MTATQVAELERQEVAFPGRYLARRECSSMTDPLGQVRAQKALVEKLTAERDAVQAHLDEVAKRLADAENNLIVDTLEAFENGVTPKQIHDLTGMPRSSLHYFRGRNLKRRVN